MAAMMTGTCASVATSGPTGSEPSGVNATIASMESNTANCTRNNVRERRTEDAMAGYLLTNCLHIIYYLCGYGK